MPYAIITGDTQGMGKVIAEKLLHEGFSIAICARNKQKLAAAEAEWNEKFPEASIIAYNADVSVKEEINALADTVMSNFPEIDVVVNNVGMFLGGDIADEPDGRLEEMLATNLFCAYRLTRKVLPVMKKDKKGHIFNICSVASLRANPGSGAYSISKYALLGFSENLREELKPHNIKVTAICPGSTLTSSWDGSGVAPGTLLESSDIAAMLWNAWSLSPQANVDMIVIRSTKESL